MPVQTTSVVNYLYVFIHCKISPKAMLFQHCHRAIWPSALTWSCSLDYDG